MRRLILAALAAGAALTFAPAADALCVTCDSRGCHVTSESCVSESFVLQTVCDLLSEVTGTDACRITADGPR